MKTRNFGMVLILSLVGSVAQAGFIDFGVTPVPGSPGSTINNFSFAGGGSSLMGVGAPVTTVTGEGTTTDPGHLIPGVPYAITNGSLDFTTGGFLNNDGGLGWTFAAGGSIKITGNIPFINSLATELFSGTFTQNTTIISEGSGFKVIGGGFRGNFNGLLADEFGVPTGMTYSGSLALLFNSPSIPGGNIGNTTLLSGNIGIDTVPFSGGGGTVPEPSSFALMGVGIVGIGLWHKARRKRS